MNDASEGGLQFLQSNPNSSDAETAHPLGASSKYQTLTRGRTVAMSVRMRGIGKRFVYILRSQADPKRHYVGNTGDVDERLDWHNHGPSGYTIAHRPWSISVAIEFPTEAEALRFEHYLKSGSGRAFAKRHFGVT